MSRFRHLLVWPEPEETEVCDGPGVDFTSLQAKCGLSEKGVWIKHLGLGEAVISVLFSVDQQYMNMDKIE